jgi:hypothetical protein
MKHILFAYPSGAAGCALVLFRLSAAILIAGASVAAFDGDVARTALAYLTSLGLVTGFPTRIIAAACAVAGVYVATTTQVYPVACLAAFILSMLALTLIGPGAYSVDAILFGRRKVYLLE